MLIQLLLFFLLLLLLFLLSGKITSLLYAFFFRVFNNDTFSIRILAFLLLPGTIIHELSHFVLATILFVPTGKLTVFPSVEKRGEKGEIYVKAGRLELGDCDPFRRILIGLAPLIIGLTLIYYVGKILFPNLSFILNTKDLILHTLGIYMLFTISITMFSSPKDLESLKIVAPVLFLLFISVNLVGIKIELRDNLAQNIYRVLSDLNLRLIICAVIDLCFFFFLKAGKILWQKRG